MDELPNAAPWLRKTLRYVGFVVGLLMEACSGTLYAWSSYSTELGDQLGYGKTELAVIVGIGDIGLYLSGVLAGVLFLWVGPRWTSLLGGALMCFGYLMMAFTYSGALAQNHYVLMGLYFCLAGVGSSCAYTSGLSTNVNNFGTSVRGLVVGVLVSLYGLSALIFTLFNSALFIDTVVVTPTPLPSATTTPQPVIVEELDTFSYLLFLAYVPAIICAISFFTMWVVGTDEGPTNAIKPFISEDIHDYETTTGNDPVEVDRSLSSVNHDQSQNTEAPVEADLAEEIDSLLDHAPKKHSVTNGQPEKEINFNTIRLFKTRDFWLMFVALMFGSGAGLMYINSVGYIVSSLATESDDVRYWTDLQVALTSAMSCAGRMGMGTLSDLLLTYFGIRRRILFAWCIGMMLLSQILVIFMDSLQFLTFVTILVGFSYGGQFSVTPTVVAERFGVMNFGINWGWMCWATAIGGQIMTLVFGVFYDKLADENEHCPEGPDCYLPTFYITSILCGIGLLISIVYSMRRREIELEQMRKSRGLQKAYH